MSNNTENDKYRSWEKERDNRLKKVKEANNRNDSEYDRLYQEEWHRQHPDYKQEWLKDHPGYFKEKSKEL